MPIAPLPAGTPGTTTTFGSDFAGVDDLDANWSFLENSPTTPNVESLALAQAIARRLTTPRGGLFYDPNYGTDLRDFIGSSITVPTAISLIETECLKDERVETAKATITVLGETWTIKIECKANSGATFELTLSVDKVTVALLSQAQGPP